LADEFSGAIAGGGDGFEGFAVGIIEGFLDEEEAGVALDDGENVVEIVGDAGGQLADGFHFLDLAQLIFQGVLLGDILGEEEQEFFAIQFEEFDG
jgi:hypothetical protein